MQVDETRMISEATATTIPNNDNQSIAAVNGLDAESTSYDHNVNGK